MRQFVILRPQPGGSASVAKARALGLDARAMPLFAIRPLAWTSPDPAHFDALLLTSANAARCGGCGLAKLNRLPVHSVGEATAAAAREAGLTVATVGHGDVAELLASLPPGQRLLHLCGGDRHDSGATGHAIAAVPVYRSEPLAMPGDFAALAGAVVAVHSPRAAARLAELADAAGLDRSRVRVAAISEAAARAAGPGWGVVASVARPDDGALLALAARLCDDGGAR